MRMNKRARGRLRQPDRRRRARAREPAPLVEGRRARLLLRARPSSQQACTIGGNIANNSGGPHTLKYGVTTNHVLGLEVVMPDGEIVWLGGKTREACGYDLAGVFVGSEGTFGIATQIVVRILKKPQAVKTILAVFDAIDRASSRRVGDHRARARARRDGDDRPSDDPGGRGRVQLRLSARRRRGAADRARRPRRRHGRAGRGDRRRVPRVGRARGPHGEERGRAAAALERPQVRLRRVRPRVAGLHGDGRRHSRARSFRTYSAA